MAEQTGIIWCVKCMMQQRNRWKILWLPQNCSASPPSIDPLSVEKLNFHGCDSDEVLNSTKFHKNIRDLDVSNSKYNTFDWFNAPLDNLKFFDASHNPIENITENITDFLANALYVTHQITFSFNRIFCNVE